MIPFVFTPPPSARAQELGRRIAETVREFQEGHELTRTDVEQAFGVARQLIGGGIAGARILAAVLGALVAAGLALLVFARSGVTAPSIPVVLIAVAVIGILAVFVALRR